MRIAIDIDSTLHEYWHQFSAIAERRFGVSLPYDLQDTWGITRLRPEQVDWCVAESHRDEHVLTAEPYPGAVDVINRWIDAGHEIHIASHRAAEAHDVTARWLEQIGLRPAALHCVPDKIPVCCEIGAGLLIDDSPLNLEQALEAGILAATLDHPWNADFCATEDVIRAPDWPALEAALEPQLAGGDRSHAER